MEPLASRSPAAADVPYLRPAEQEAVGRALLRARQWHSGHARESGEPYVIHPIAVAQYLKELEADRDTIIAALLHDVVEEDGATFDEIESEFGPTVRMLVDGVTKLTRQRYESGRSFRQVASLRKMLLTASEDLRVIFIKLADRLHNAETLSALPEDKQKRIAHETLDIYVPFSRLLGLWSLKTRLEDACFPIAFPVDARAWHEAIAAVRTSVASERETFLQKMNRVMPDFVTAELNPQTDFEIYQRLQGNLQRLEDVHNVDTVLLLVQSDNPLECYRALGTVHQRYPVSSGGFRDFIAAPQPNGYQALHTAVFLSQNHQVRLRIQTREMHDFATERKLSSWSASHYRDVTQALRSLHTGVFDIGQYMQDLQGTVLQRIHVFTSAGDVIALPHHSTGVDFAFTVNPEHLRYLVGIRVNGQQKEATYQLKDGDIVDLVLSEDAAKSRHPRWLDKVKTIEAKREIRSTLGQLPASDQREEGKHLIAVECRKRKLPLWCIFHVPTVQKKIARALSTESFPVLLERVGTGQLPVTQVVDAYKDFLIKSPGWPGRILQWLGLLPRTRFLEKDSHVFSITILTEDRQGMIYDISRCFAERQMNIARFEVFAVPPKDNLYRITLEAENFDTFSDLYDCLLEVPSVKNVLRRS